MVHRRFLTASRWWSSARATNRRVPRGGKPRCAVLVCTLLLMIGLVSVVCGDGPPRQLPAPDPILRRLPQLIRVSHGRRHGSRRFVSTTHDAPVDDRDWLFFASESFEAPVPPGWHVREAAFGRDVRMVLTPVKVVGTRLPNNVIWVSCSVDPNLRKLQLGELLRRRIDAHISETARTHPSERTHLSGNPAASATFSERRAEGSVEGGHLLVSTDWAIYEIHWSYPMELASSQRQLVQDWLSEIEFHRPREQRQALPPEIAAAAVVVGSWKAYHSRIRFFPNGRVVIIRDPIRIMRVDVPKPERMEKLIGTYRGKEDLLHVVWDDGSKLNFRWRVDGDRLLLTDHEGRVSQLRRLLE